MDKILKTEFRKELYNNLIEAGSTKEEAIELVSTFYRKSLINILREKFTNIIQSLDNEDYSSLLDKLNFSTEIGMEYNDIVNEIIKLTPKKE